MMEAVMADKQITFEHTQNQQKLAHVESFQNMISDQHNPSTAHATSAKGFTIRSNSVEDLKNLLINPYELSQGDPAHQFKLKQNSPSARKQLMQAQKSNLKNKNQGKSVPFGSSSRRPIGQTSLREITQFTYIPDIRRMQAISTQQLKEQRYVERQTANFQKQLRKANPQPTATERQLGRDSNSCSLAKIKVKVTDQQSAYGGMTDTKNINSMRATSHLENKSMKYLVNVTRSQSTSLPGVDPQNFPTKFKLLNNKDQVSSQEAATALLAILDQKRQSFDSSTTTYSKKIGVVPDLNNSDLPSILAQAERDIQTLSGQKEVDEVDIRIQNHNIVPPSSHDVRVGTELRQSRESKGPDDNFLERTTEQIRMEPGAQPRYSHPASTDDNQSKDEYRNKQDSDNDMPRKSSRLLNEQKSVQQMSRATLQIESHRPNENKNRAKRRKKGAKSSGLLKKAIAKSNAGYRTNDFRTTPQNNAIVGVFQSRKLAPAESLKDQLKKNIMAQKLHSVATSQSKINLERLATDFLEQLQGNKPLPKTPLLQNHSQSDLNEQQRVGSLPVIDRGRMKAFDKQDSTDEDSVSLERSNSAQRLLISKKKLQNNYSTVRQQRQQLLSVIQAQNKDSKPGLSPLEAYITMQHDKKHTQSPTNLAHNIPIKNSISVQGTYSSLKRSWIEFEEKIPRSELQSQLTNEKNYHKISLKKASKTTPKTKLRNELNETLPVSFNEIIPRLKNFPHQGRLIKVEGHDDKQAFSNRHKHESNTKLNKSSTTVGREPSHKFSAVEQQRAIRKARQSIDQLLGSVPSKKNIEVQVGVRHHYLDDEIRGKKFMQSVGPTSYETMNKVVSVPINLQPIVAPAIIYRDLQNQSRLIRNKNSSLSSGETLTQMNRDSSFEIGQREVGNMSHGPTEVMTPQGDKPGEIIINPMKLQSNTSGDFASLDTIKQPVKMDGNLRFGSSIQMSQNQSVNDSREFGDGISSSIHKVVLLPAIHNKSQESNEVSDPMQNATAEVTVDNRTEQTPIRVRKENKPANLTSIQINPKKVSEPFQVKNSRMANQTQSRSQNLIKRKDTGEGLSNHTKTPVDSTKNGAKGQRDISERKLSSNNEDLNAVLTAGNEEPEPTGTKQFGQALSNITGESIAEAIDSKDKANEETEQKESLESVRKADLSNNSSFIKNNKGIAASQLSRQIKGESQRQGAKISEPKTFADRIIMPQMVTYQIQGSVYDPTKSGNASYRQVSSSKDTTPLRLKAIGSANFTDLLLSNRQNDMTPQAQEQQIKHLNTIGKQSTLREIPLEEHNNEYLNNSGVINLNKDGVPIKDIVELERSQDAQRITTLLGNTQHSIEQTDKHNQAPIVLPSMDLQNSKENSDQSRSDFSKSREANSTDREGHNENKQMITINSEQQRIGQKMVQTKKNLLNQAMNQVKALKQERQGRQKVIHGSNVGKPNRFRQNDEAQNKATPGPGAYDSAPIKDAYNSPNAKNQSFNRKKPVVGLSNNQSRKQLDVENQNLAPPEAPQPPQKDQKSQSPYRLPKKAPEDNQRSSVSQSKLTSTVHDRKQSSSFASKVPRQFQGAGSQASEFTGTIDYNDQTSNTISKAQNQLTLRTVQKMFAGRKEQHTINSQKLVRINRLQQLNKQDPLINYEAPKSRARVKGENEPQEITIADSTPQASIDIADKMLELENEEYHNYFAGFPSYDQNPNRSNNASLEQLDQMPHDRTRTSLETEQRAAQDHDIVMGQYGAEPTFAQSTSYNEHGMLKLPDASNMRTIGQPNHRHSSQATDQMNGMKIVKLQHVTPPIADSHVVSAEDRSSTTLQPISKYRPDPKLLHEDQEHENLTKSQNSSIKRFQCKKTITEN